ncbi:MAG: hypothetical protein A2V65_12150 [Deltaproteobacteria bacterium RBG_13_49_15]|nr:MAG: hypothetical protein A2V65_12150 [Deltaproteobacteria bacterium RBG_13_49_15]
MPFPFKPGCLPLLIGSLPLSDHAKAMALILKYTPEIPSWPQLPTYREEMMVAQFLEGLPGVKEQGSSSFVDTEDEEFDVELLRFYEEYLAVTEGSSDLLKSRFSLNEKTAKGFFKLIEVIETLSPPPLAVKGQITGPVTAGTALKKKNGQAVFYDEQMRDVLVKILTLKARWQARSLSRIGSPVIIFIDEPGMAGFGSSELISISREQVNQSFEPVIEGIKSEGGLAGIHVCANTDWSLILESPFDIINFDAYSYFDRFILYAEPIRRFIRNGGIIAYGLVPTLNIEDLQKETPDSLSALWEARVRLMADLGIDRNQVIRQSLITPSCGAGSLNLDLMTKVLKLTRSISDRSRNG